MSKVKRFILGLVVLCILLVVGYGAYLGYSIYQFSHKISTLDSSVTREVYEEVYEDDKTIELAPPVVEENINILVVGIDGGKFVGNSYRADVGRTDTIMLFSINPNTKKVSLLSVPRDTYVDIEGTGMDKVNHAYAFGGMNLSIKTLSKFLGIPIHHYIRVDYQSFTEIVDGLGGVTVNVTEDAVSYGDGKVKVHKGVQKMDGETAFLYVRVREGDIGRISRQQNFVKTLAAQALTISTLPKLPGILESVAPDIQTDMSPKQMLDMGLQMRSVDFRAIQNEIVPGQAAMINGISYWIPDQDGTKAAVERLLK